MHSCTRKGEFFQLSHELLSLAFSLSLSISLSLSLATKKFRRRDERGENFSPFLCFPLSLLPSLATEIFLSRESSLPFFFFFSLSCDRKRRVPLLSLSLSPLALSLSRDENFCREERQVEKSSSSFSHALHLSFSRPFFIFFSPSIPCARVC